MLKKKKKDSSNQVLTSRGTDAELATLTSQDGHLHFSGLPGLFLVPGEVPCTHVATQEGGWVLGELGVTEGSIVDRAPSLRKVEGCDWRAPRMPNVKSFQGKKEYHDGF